MTTPLVEPDVSAHAVARQLSALLPPMHFLLRPGRHGSHGRRDEPPTPEMRGQFRMMLILQHAGQITMNDLATAMNVTPPTVTGIVKRLAAQGDVVRIPDPEDGRTIRVELTEAGRARMEAHRAQHVAKLEHLLAQIDEEDRRAIEQAVPALWRLLGVAHSNGLAVDACPGAKES